MATTKKNNLDLYNQFRNTPKEAQKSFNNGSFSGTDINPMYRIKALTEAFGPCGLGWYYEPVEHWTKEVNGEILAYMAINLYIKDPETGEWSKPIYGVGGNKELQRFDAKIKGEAPRYKSNDESAKMALTDALSVACKALGIGADIYWAADRTKYTMSTGQEEATEKPANEGRKGTGRATTPATPHKAVESPGNGQETSARKLTDGQYWGIVLKCASGEATKDGKDYRTAWMEYAKPGAEEVAKFDHDVDLARAAKFPAK